MGNGAIGNGSKFKEFIKNVGIKIKEGVGNVVEFGKKFINMPSIKDLINIGTTALGVPLPVGDMICTSVDIAGNLLGGGNQKRDILKDSNKYDFKSSID
jgi:hypothetical protein